MSAHFALPPTAPALPPIPLEVQKEMKQYGFELTAAGLVAYNQYLKEWIANLTVREMEIRKLAVAHTFTNKHEGTNRTSFGEGKDIKAVVKYNYALRMPEGSKAKSIVEVVDAVIDRFRRISNEGVFIADRLFNWKVDISVTEYRKLQEEAKVDQQKAKLLKELEPILNITEAAPTLEIVAAKGGRK